MYVYIYTYIYIYTNKGENCLSVCLSVCLSAIGAETVRAIEMRQKQKFLRDPRGVTWAKFFWQCHPG